jgi:tetratricopeptide (TPR) repeat protein
MKPSRVFLVAACIGALIGVAGCASFSGGGDDGTGRGNALGGNAAADLGTAQRMIQSGNYSIAIPRLQSLIAQYPNAPESLEARYFLGVAHSEIGGQSDAARYLREYVDRSPSGTHASEARQLLATVAGEIDSRTVSDQELTERAAALRQQIEAEPNQPAAWLELADLYWQTGRYTEAGEVYAAALKRLPDLADNPAVRSRVEGQVDGSYVVVTPQEAARRYAEEEPLLLYNTTSFRSGRPSGWSGQLKHDIYTVSGQAKNRGSSVLYNVQVVVTIYGFTGMVYDSRVINIGQMQPGQARAFSAPFSNFDDIENVHHYECVGSYER